MSVHDLIRASMACKGHAARRPKQKFGVRTANVPPGFLGAFPRAAPLEAPSTSAPFFLVSLHIPAIQHLRAFALQTATCFVGRTLRCDMKAADQNRGFSP